MLIRRLGWGYVLLMALWLLLRLVFFDRLWWLALINSLAFYLLLPLVWLVPAAIWWRQSRLLLGLALPLLVFVMFFGALFIPAVARPRQPAHGPTLIAMSFNLLWSNRNYDKIVEAIQTVDPDIIGFQEATPKTIAELLPHLTSDYPYHTFGSENPTRSVGVFSRWPLVGAASLPHPPLERAMRVVVRVGERPLTVFVGHLAPNNMLGYPLSQFTALTAERYAVREAESRYLQQELQSLGEPALLLCDCNMTDTSETYTILSTTLHDSFQEAGWGLGHTLYVGSIPVRLQRVDYIWHTGDLVATDARVGPDGGSDHRPIVATLQFVR
jgi:endonuclease/exonuclease/phosphatase (EEP) superfamily protein YafD